MHHKGHEDYFVMSLSGYREHIFVRKLHGNKERNVSSKSWEIYFNKSINSSHQGWERSLQRLCIYLLWLAWVVGLRSCRQIHLSSLRQGFGKPSISSIQLSILSLSFCNIVTSLGPGGEMSKRVTLHLNTALCMAETMLVPSHLQWNVCYTTVRGGLSEMIRYELRVASVWSLLFVVSALESCSFPVDGEKTDWEQFFFSAAPHCVSPGRSHHSHCCHMLYFPSKCEHSESLRLLHVPVASVGGESLGMSSGMNGVWIQCVL